MRSPWVLVVEDDEGVGEAITDAVSTAGSRPVWARNGREALAALERGAPSLMLVDMFMPVMNGAEFLGIVRRSPQWARIPRFVMTGANDPMIAVKQDAALLFKPVDLDALVRLVRRYASGAPARAETATQPR
jgi:CheY-like chemotaxis protein